MVLRYADTLIVFRIIALLAKKWEDHEAFKHGIIDANGNPLKKVRELKTAEEKNAYTMLHRMVFKLKRLLNKVPKGARTIATYGAALWLIKERYSLSDKDMELIQEEIKKVPCLLNEAHHGRIGFYDDDEDPTDKASTKMKKELKKRREKKLDETAAMSASSVNVAGLDKDPPGRKSRFAGSTVFDVDSDTYCKTFNCKKKRKRWKNYLSMEDLDLSERIREYANKHPKEGIIIRDMTNGAMRYIRHPKK